MLILIGTFIGKFCDGGGQLFGLKRRTHGSQKMRRKQAKAKGKEPQDQDQRKKIYRKR